MKYTSKSLFLSRFEINKLNLTNCDLKKKKKKILARKMSLIQTAISRFAVKSRTHDSAPPPQQEQQNQPPPSRLSSISKLNRINTANSSSDHAASSSSARRVVAVTGSRFDSAESISSNSSRLTPATKKRGAVDSATTKKRIVVVDNEENLPLLNDIAKGTKNYSNTKNDSVKKPAAFAVVDAEEEIDSGELPPVRKAPVLKQFGSGRSLSTVRVQSLSVFHATLDSPSAPPDSPVVDADAAAATVADADDDDDVAPTSGHRSSTAAWKALLSGSEMHTANNTADDDDDASFGTLNRRRTSATPYASSQPRASRAATAAAEAVESSGNTKLTQMYLDYGQKNFTSVTCGECGLVYAPGLPEDEATHKKAHAKFVNESLSVGKRWRAQATLAELVVRTYAADGSSLLAVRADARAAERMAAVRRVMDVALGYVPSGGDPRETLYVLVAHNGDVLGCCVAYPICEAFAVDSDASVSGAVEVSKRRYVGGVVRMGVSRIWVRAENRRRGLARRILDGARATFDYAGALGVEEIAFTQPTPDGMALLKAYVGADRALLVCK